MIYNSYAPYNISEYNHFLSKECEECVKIDIQNRKTFIKQKLEIELTYNKNYFIMKEYMLSYFYTNDSFQKSVFVANKNLYKLVMDNKIKKSTLKTLIKYIYKQENCCTPSSMWSGLSYISPSYKGLNKSNFVVHENNKHKIKHLKSSFFCKNIINCLNKNQFYLNPTLLKVGNKYVYNRFDKDSVKKVTVNTNKTIDSMISNFRYKKIKYKDFFEFLGNDFDSRIETLNILIRNDLLRIYSDLSYGNYDMLVCHVNNLDIVNMCKYDFFTRKFPDVFLKKKDIKIINKIFYNGTSTYLNLFHILYFDENKKFKMKLLDFLSKKGKMSLLEFLHSDYESTVIDNFRQKNYRNWQAPKKECNKKKYEHLISFFKSKYKELNMPYEIRVSLEDIFKNYEVINSNNRNEYIYQIDYKNEVLIPEMISSTIGRLLGRYIKYFDQKTQNKILKYMEKQIDLSKMVQVNIEIYNLTFPEQNKY